MLHPAMHAPNLLTDNWVKEFADRVTILSWVTYEMNECAFLCLRENNFFIFVGTFHI